MTVGFDNPGGEAEGSWKPAAPSRSDHLRRARRSSSVSFLK